MGSLPAKVCKEAPVSPAANSQAPASKETSTRVHPTCITEHVSDLPAKARKEIPVGLAANTQAPAANEPSTRVHPTCITEHVADLPAKAGKEAHVGLAAKHRLQLPMNQVPEFIQHA